MIYLLDTSELLAPHRQEEGGEGFQALFDDTETQIMLAAVSLADFARRLRDLCASRKYIEGTLADYEQLFSKIVPVNKAIALASVEIICQPPQPLPLMDAIIAATAGSQGASAISIRPSGEHQSSWRSRNHRGAGHY